MNIVRSKWSEENDLIPVKTYEENSFHYPVWEFRLGRFGSPFLVIGLGIQEAIDNLIDFLEEDGGYPGFLADYNDDYIQELMEDAKRDGHDEMTYVDEMYLSGGNHGLFLTCEHWNCEIIDNIPPAAPRRSWSSL
jgi:hypothetical protein